MNAPLLAAASPVSVPGRRGVVAVYRSHLEAEVAVKRLHDFGFDLKQLSIIGRDFHTEERVVGYYNTGDRMQYWGTMGAFWGGAWSLLFGSAFFILPGVGPFLVAGPLVAWIVGALEGAVVVGGLAAISASLVGLGIPRDSVLACETAFTAGKFLVIAHGSAAEAGQARDVLHHTGPDLLTGHLALTDGRPISGASS